MKLSHIFFLIAIFYFSASSAQSPGTAEDSLNNNVTSFLSHTTIGGYGNLTYTNDFNRKFAKMNLDRFVLFVGHKFSQKISFFGEMEVEDAKVAGGENGGELALEQCYLKFMLNNNTYIVGGLFLPRIGILNENHLPNSFNGNERTQVETFVLPSTWREIGVGLYGSLNRFPINYSIGLVNGLNSAGFEHGSGIREGRFEGRDASANNLALTGSLRYLKNNFTFQMSGYYGGTVGLNKTDADSLKLTGGMFGTPVLIGEADVQYHAKGFEARVLATSITIPDAKAINTAYGNETPEGITGGYIELGYNVLENIGKKVKPDLIVFARYEMLNLNSKVPDNTIKDGTLNQQHIVTGINYLPNKNVVVKLDMRFSHTGKPDVNTPEASVYKQNNSFLNLGIGFSF